MKLIVITSPQYIYQEQKLIQEIVENELADIHFRKPECNEQEVADYFLSLPNNVREQLISHSMPHIADKLKLKGIHFTAKTKHLLAAYKTYKGSKSISCHAINEINQYTEDFNYHFLSPIFASISKPGYGGDSFNFDQIKQFTSSNLGKRIVALGGINEQNILQCKEMGFKGVALLGSIWNNYEKNQDINNILYFLEKLHKLWGK